MQNVVFLLCIHPNIESITNSMITQSLFPDKAKVSSITPVYKKDDRMEKKNYRPISVLSCLSKVLEKIIFQQMGTYFENIFLHIFQVLESAMAVSTCSFE